MTTTDAGATPWLRIAAIMAVSSGFSFSTGFAFPAISLDLEARGFSATAIGAQAAMAGAGIALGGLIGPWLAGRFGQWRVAVVSVVVDAVMMAAYGVIPPIAAWFVLRLVLATSASTLFLVSETLLLEAIPDQLRGRLIGGYATLNSVLFGAGPALIPLIGFSGMLPYFLVGLVILSLAVPLQALRGIKKPVELIAPGQQWAIVPRIPVLLLGIFVFSFTDAAFLSLWSVYALGHGVSTNTVVLHITALSVGGAVLQVPIGWLSDRWSRRGVFATCAAAGLVDMLLIPILRLDGWTVPLVLAFWGGLTLGLFTVALVAIGDQLKDGDLIAANGAFGIAWGIGTMLGTASIGVLMDAAGNDLLPVAVAMPYALLLVAGFISPLIRK